MAKASPENLSPAQFEIMEIVWSRKDAGVADVWRALEARRPVARNTVQTMLTRLYEKGWLNCRQDGNTFYYTAARPRKQVIGKLITRMVDSAFGGSAAGLVLALLEKANITSAEAKRIREMIEVAERRKKEES